MHLVPKYPQSSKKYWLIFEEKQISRIESEGGKIKNVSLSAALLNYSQKEKNETEWNRPKMTAKQCGEKPFTVLVGFGSTSAC
uniref:Uncharacterized protein n=1 Tax=Romanomermis culicivorax TaxID=13658 RepID=A0A915HKJ8_ROMCU